jgi:CheY-like chemotaxis protein
MVKILLADDSEFFRKLYSEELVKAGFDVDLATDGQDAVNKIRAGRPSLVFMDLVMPEMSGADALEALKKDPDVKTIPVVMLTSISADIKGEDLLLKGAVAYLVKDHVSPADVIAKAEEILGTSEAPLNPNAPAAA